MGDQTIIIPRKRIRDAINSGDLKWLLTSAGELHGHYCPGLALGVRSAYRAVRDLDVHSTGMEEVIAVVETNSCFADGAQFVTGCTFGNNALIFRDFGKTALTLATRDGAGIRVTANMDRDFLAKREPEAMAMFQKVVAERQGTDKDQARLKELWQRASFNILGFPDNDLLQIEEITVELPAYASIFESVRCSLCGESVMQSRIRERDGQPVCIPCSGGEYYELNGNGITSVSQKQR